MLFTSYGFIAFLTVIFLLYYVVPKKFQWVLLLAGSYFFYACAGIHFLAYIAVTSVTTWFAAQRITAILEEQSCYLKANKGNLNREEKKTYKAKMKKKTRKWMLPCLLLNIGILAVIKYTDFVISNINSIFSTGFTFMNFALPMGISFYTFQSMGYLIDVYRGKYPAQESLPKFALFVSFFPQMVQGPISRYDQLADTLYSPHSFDLKPISFGLQRILWGFFKKLLVADRLVVAVKTLVGSPSQYTGGYVILAIFFYAIELYADFTGGIDITIGIAEVFGIRLTENFIRPYFSKNINEYWTRWHITMGTWFKDYIFYPISVCQPMLKLSKASREKFGKEVGKRVPVYLANIVVWFTTGLWHGASWNFIVWGMLNCLVTLVSYEMEPLYAKFHGRYHLNTHRWYDGFQVIRTFWLMGAIRILDCYRNVPVTFCQLGSIFTTFNGGEIVNGGWLGLGLGLADYGVVLSGSLLMLLVSLKGRRGSVREMLAQKPDFWRKAAYLALLFVEIIFGAYGEGYDDNQLIYNQF